MGAAIHAASLVDQGSRRRLPARRDAALAPDRRRRRAHRDGDRAQHAGADRADAHVHHRARRPGDGQDPRLPGRVARGDENELLGQFEFSGFQRGARGEVEIDVTFEINTDGIVNVTASDQRTGQRASTRDHALLGPLGARDQEHHRPRRRRAACRPHALAAREAGGAASALRRRRRARAGVARPTPRAPACPRRHPR